MISIHSIEHQYIKPKLCQDCKYFIKPTKLCQKFIKQSMIDGTIKYPKAEEIRQTVDYCGRGAKYFEEIANSFEH